MWPRDGARNSGPDAWPERRRDASHPGGPGPGPGPGPSAGLVGGPILEIGGLDVRYGQAHVLQGVSLAFDRGVLAVVGRNGMGKTTLCNAITGLLPSAGSARAIAQGSIRVAGRELLGLTPNRITGVGVAYVPQGRRVWPSLTVDEHLRLVAGRRRGGWDVDRVYQTFPRLAERRRNGGAQLSGGEQQMLAIGRALLLRPRLLVMDEPTEGLAPVIVQQVATMLKTLAGEGEIAVLLVEQNLGVAIDVADRVVVMVNGRVASDLGATALAADIGLQQRLLGVRSGPEEGDGPGASVPQGSSGDGDRAVAPSSRGAGSPVGAPGLAGSQVGSSRVAPPRVVTVRRAGDGAAPGDEAGRVTASDDSPRPVRAITRWNAADPRSDPGDRRVGPASASPAPPLPSRPAAQPRDALVARRADAQAGAPAATAAAVETRQRSREARVIELPVAATLATAAYIAGTFDTKARELIYLRDCLEKLGLRTVTVDLSTSGKPSPAMVHPREIARHHPAGESAVFTGDRGSAVDAMAEAFARYALTRRDLGGLLSAGGSGGTALATAAMRSLPVGVPKLMVSTVASGDVSPYVGPTDICMMYSVTDISGINRISEQVLSNAAHALAGMIRHRRRPEQGRDSRPAVALTMFGVTTTCVQATARALESRFDCLTFHATGTGGRSMEKLVDSGLISAALDITTTEVCDELVGGVLSAGPDRFGAFARAAVPWVGSCGALDMVNFWAFDTVPERFRTRRLYRHNPNVTLMRTTADECRRIGEWIGERINRMRGPVRFLIPEGGVSALDAPGQPFHDPQADKALFDALAATMSQTNDHRLQRLPWHINDPRFSDALVAALDEVLASNSSAAPRSFAPSRALS